MYQNIMLIIATILVIGAIIGILAVYIYIFKHYHYRCVKCSALYKPDTLWQSMCGINGGSQRKLKCPNCNTREWADMIKGAIPNFENN
ncbi:MAG: hypothetical protein FWG63_12715 [Defluviitaleaceae bacterium]|nr:hypothetical protein [Defluviitaleaceae bacterium]